MWVKICGIRDNETASAVAALAPDAVGLNFYNNTPRNVDIRTAAQIVASLPPDVEPVGLFVNDSPQAILDMSTECSLRTIQLHGDESPEQIQDVKQSMDGCRIIRAWNLGPEGLSSLEEHLDQLDGLGVVPTACLIDARVPGQHGGTGRTVDWKLLNREYNRDAWPPLILAGGLTPENIGDAIHTVRPWGVDVASGVESAPGLKDMTRVEQFINNARAAFRSVENETLS